MAHIVLKYFHMSEEQNKPVRRLRLRRGGVEELRKITDPVEFAISAADYLGIPPFTLPPGFTPNPDYMCDMKFEAWSRVKALPIARVNGRLTVAFSDPFDLPAQEEVSRWCHSKVWPVVIPSSELNDVMNSLKQAEDAANPALAMETIMKGDDEGIEMSADSKTEDMALDASVDAAGDAPVIRMVNSIMVEALKTKASDIHFEAMEKTSRLRYRIDGELVERPAPPKALHNAVCSRIKILSNLDIAERRLPQDGRIKLKLGHGREMDFRVSVLPCLFGEKVVMRLLDKSNLQLDMTKLGFEPRALTDFKEAIHRPYGMVLVTGPTGSGKTTTLYSALSELNTVTENISTAEDPVEFNLMGINQVQMHDAIGLNFAAALRSFLRQDPDIIMVGEIRDFETAEIAVKSALTGHMVLSTLHTNDAPSTISRLLNMGIEPFLVTSSVNLILAQRLARKLCPFCRKQAVVDAETLRNAQVPEDKIATAQVYEPGAGCDKCNNGFKGRIALYEVMVFGEELRNAVLQGWSTAELKAEAILLGMQTLRMAGINKVLEGTTSLTEVCRVTAPD